MVKDTILDSTYKIIKKKYKKAMVTGGAGFIGSHICEELAIRGFDVLSIDDYSAGKKENLKHLKKYKNFKEVNCDITDEKKLNRYFKGVDLVFHNAASKKNVCLKNPRRDLAVNGGGTFNLLDLAKKHGVKKFVHASTGSVYGERIKPIQDENHPLNPVSYYGVSKLAGEKYVQLFCKLHGLNTTILRYFHVYGARQEFNQYGGVVAIFVDKLLFNQRPVIFGTGEQERSFTYVKDVVNANFLVAANDESKGEIYNCASGIKVTINDLCQAVLKYFNQEKVKPVYEDWLVGDIKSFKIDNKKIKKIGMTFQTDFFRQLTVTIGETKDYIKNAKKRSTLK